jgi:tetratricopeptide (TPR) repeat protein
VFAAQFPETSETQPELLAHHYTEAGLIEPAVDCWYKAGQKASERSAHVEAIGYLTQGLRCIDALPESSRHQHELRLLLLLGPALTFTKGHTSAESQEVYARAQALCQLTGETTKLLDVLYGLRRFYATCGEQHIAREFAEQALNLAAAEHDQVALLFCHYSLAVVLYYLGELLEAHTHFERGLVLSEDLRECAPERFIRRVGVDSRITCRITFANALWLLGYPEQARQRVDEALKASQTLSHPSTHGVVLIWAKDVYDWRREPRLVQERAQELMRSGREQNYEMLEVIGNIEQSFVLALQEQSQEHLQHLRQSITDLQTRFNSSTSYYLFRLARTYAAVGHIEAGRVTLDEVMARLEQTEERYYAAELHRLKGELLLAQPPDNATEAELCFQQALSIARSQHAKSWELRAAMSLARLWQRQGKRQDAYDLLVPVYAWFTEGFDTADLQEAKALLQLLA